MQLSLQNFTALVSLAAAAVQASARQLLDLSVGSTLRAILEANASVALWLQWLIVQVLQMTRAATSSGPDLDSWMADFSLARLPATSATGMVTFSRFVPIASAFVPLGTLVRTADGTQTFEVTEDPTNPAWSASQNGYLIGPNVGSISVPVAAVAPGSAGNVVAGSISLIVAALPGIDTVTNPAALAGGLDGESDDAFRARFPLWLAALSRATPTAISSAVTAMQQNLTMTLQENVNPNGTTQMGSFVVTVNDGSGAPPAALLSSVATAIEAVRPVGTTFAVLGPVSVPATIVLTITTASGTVHADAVAAATSAITTYVNGLPIGALLAYSRLAQLAYDSTPAVTNVNDILLNGSTADLVPAPNGVVTAASVTVS